MLFTTVFSLFALAAVGQAAPAPAGLEIRASKYHCETKYSGTLTGLHRDKPFSFTRSGDLVTYLGDNETKNVLKVEFQACSTGKPKKDGTDWVGRLKIKGSNSCVELLNADDGAGLPKIASCDSKKLTDAQTWRYDTQQFGLFWAGWFYYGNDNDDDTGGYVCRTGYKQGDEGRPVVTSNKQVQFECSSENEDKVRFFRLK